MNKVVINRLYGFLLLVAMLALSAIELSKTHGVSSFLYSLLLVQGVVLVALALRIKYLSTLIKIWLVMAIIRNGSAVYLILMAVLSPPMPELPWIKIIIG